MSDKYILDGHKTIPCDDLVKWATWFEKADRTVAKTKVAGEVLVSTVFLGLNHNFRQGPPSLFETMVFGGDFDQDCERYATWEEAEAGHAIMVAKVKPKPAEPEAAISNAESEGK